MNIARNAYSAIAAIIILMVSLVGCASPATSTPAAVPTFEAKNATIKVPRSVLNLAFSKEISAAAEAKAKEIGVPMYVSIVDASANQISTRRMENAILVSEKISMGKAYTAAAIKLPTHVLADLAQPGKSLYGIQNNSQIIIFGGGFPFILNGQVIGAIGVSGGSVEQDMTVAEAGLAKYKSVVEAMSGDSLIKTADESIVDTKITDYGINLELAKKMSAAVEKKAVEIGIPMYFSAVDKGGNMILTNRMDEALLVSKEISLNKAYTAATVKLPTDTVAKLSQPGAPLYGIQDVSRMIIFGGGYPLEYNGKIIGGIGVSGGSVDQDMAVAQAALDVYKAELSK